MKLAGDIEWRECPRCNGRGSVVLHDTYGVRSGQWVRNGRVPCPACRGKKVVPVGAKEGGDGREV